MFQIFPLLILVTVVAAQQANIGGQLQGGINSLPVVYPGLQGSMQGGFQIPGIVGGSGVIGGGVGGGGMQGIAQGNIQLPVVGQMATTKASG